MASYTTDVYMWLREEVPGNTIRCTLENDMLVAKFWESSIEQTGDPLVYPVFKPGFTSLANWDPYDEYLSNADQGSAKHMSQDWVRMSMTLRWSRNLDDMSRLAGNNKWFNELNEQLNMLYHDFSQFFAWQIYSGGGVMTTGAVPPHNVTMVDGLDLAVGTGTYGGLNPAVDFVNSDCWSSYIYPMPAGATWMNLITPGTNAYLPYLSNDVFTNISAGQIRPNIIVCDSVVGSAWRHIAEVGMQLVREAEATVPTETVGNLGFNVITYQGVPIWESPTLDLIRDETGANQMYFLNLNYFDLIFLPGYKFDMRGPTELEADGDSIKFAWVLQCQLRCTGRRWQGKVTGLPLTGAPAPGA
jgi:hypothetical protein